MKERSIIFNTEMVRAVLDGRKTQTRRVINMGILAHSGQKLINVNEYVARFQGKVSEDYYDYKCPYGKVGDRLWVRETWCPDGDIKSYAMAGEPIPICYKADWDKDLVSKEEAREVGIIWKSSRFMPRWASRINLEITEDIRVERVQDISFLDAIAEGVRAYGEFYILWNSINKKRGYSYEQNPWVWVITFKQIKKALKQLINFERDTSKVRQFNNPDATIVENYKLVSWNEYLRLNKGV